MAWKTACSTVGSIQKNVERLCEKPSDKHYIGLVKSTAAEWNAKLSCSMHIPYILVY